MNNFPSDSTAVEDAIDTAAAEWLCEREEGFAPGHAAAFAAWRAADARHEIAVVRTERAMALIAEMPAVRERLESTLAEPASSDAEVIRWPGFRPARWMAAVAAAVVLGASFWWLTPGRSVPSQRY